ncbi:MAG: hypothetical protein EPN49_00050 [Rhodanobacter sp.]|nr:MAG: hypothetical protein EPN49_00050 [Rhodanobacter sp.]
MLVFLRPELDAPVSLPRHAVAEQAAAPMLPALINVALAGTGVAALATAVARRAAGRPIWLRNCRRLPATRMRLQVVAAQSGRSPPCGRMLFADVPAKAFAHRVGSYGHMPAPQEYRGQLVM